MIISSVVIVVRTYGESLINEDGGTNEESEDPDPIGGCDLPSEAFWEDLYEG